MTMHVMARRAAALATLLCVPAIVGAQAGSLAQRIAAVRDGEVRFSYATRSGVCGDGSRMIRFGRSMIIHPNMEMFGTSDARCDAGPARIAVTVRDGQAVSLRPYVGGVWDATPNARSRDLGTVSGAEAVAFLLDAARSAEGVGKSALMPAAIAEGVNVAPMLLEIGRTPTLDLKLRRRALQLAGAAGDASTAPALEKIATAGEWSGKKRSDDGVSSAAIAGLAELPDAAGMDALLRLVRDDDARVRRQAVFWLGQSGDVRGRRAARALAEDANEDVDVRAQAIFAIGMGNEATADDRTWLRELYPRLTSGKLREQVLMAAGQHGNVEDHRWLMARASDPKEATESRRKAVFWAGQGGVPIAELTSLYARLDHREVKEHVIFALSQRGEKAATDALLEMARQDPDRELRKKALFWLAQRNDPRVTRMIADIVSQ